MHEGLPGGVPPAEAEAAFDAQIDRMLMDSFPASDPPQWDSLAAGRPILRPEPPDRDKDAATARRH